MFISLNMFSYCIQIKDTGAEFSPFFDAGPLVNALNAANTNDLREGLHDVLTGTSVYIAPCSLGTSSKAVRKSQAISTAS